MVRLIRRCVNAPAEKMSACRRMLGKRNHLDDATKKINFKIFVKRILDGSGVV